MSRESETGKEDKSISGCNITIVAVGTRRDSSESLRIANVKVGRLGCLSTGS